MNIIGVNMTIYIIKPISCVVVMRADSGRVFAMCWKDGKMLASTTFAARPPQYACTPKLSKVK
jgi:hypothetical protein